MYFISIFYIVILLVLTINALLLTLNNAMCKKTYPEPINNTDKKILLLTGMINTHGHFARRKFYVIQLITRIDLDLSSYDMIE